MYSSIRDEVHLVNNIKRDLLIDKSYGYDSVFMETFTLTKIQVDMRLHGIDNSLILWVVGATNEKEYNKRIVRALETGT
jgi:hypothetical protein